MTARRLFTGRPFQTAAVLLAALVTIWPVPTRALAPLLHRVRRLTRIGMSEDGGMVVKISGRDNEFRLRNPQWSLLARDGHGPFVPVMAAAALARKLVRDEVVPGAGLACDVLSLGEIEAEMIPYAIGFEISR